MSIKLLAIFALIAFISQGCEKNNPLQGDPITMEIDGTTFKSTSIDNFDNLRDSSNWNIYPYGIFEIDTTNKFNGNSSLHLVADGGCFILEKIEGIPVSKDKVYVIHFYYKLFETRIGESSGGCVGDFMIWLKQGNETLLLDGCLGTENWTEKYFYFQPINNIPVKIELLIGTFRGVWLDDLIIFEEY